MQSSPRIDRLRARARALARRPGNGRVLAALLFAALATGVETTDASAASPFETVADVAGGVVDGVATAVTERVDAEVTKNGGGGRHLGFDTNTYPGDRTMQRWKDVEHYDWVGYYLPAPCHKDPSWSGRRATLEQQGWGLAVVYVGQQQWAGAAPVKKAAARKPARKASATRRTPAKRAPAKKSTKKRAKRAGFALGLPLPTVNALTFVLLQVRPAAVAQPAHTWDCKSELLSADQGRREGLDAVARTEAEGFPRGTIIYLDIERMEKIPAAMTAYYTAWTQAVIADGRYVPGYYAHSWNAEQIHADVKPLFEAAGVKADPRFWIASGRNFNKGKAPTDVGHQFAAIWQGVLDVTEVWGGVKLPIDVNVSDRQNPSAPAVGD